MANFAYKGRDGGGNLIEGVLEGATSGNVADVLLGRGITPVSIQETRVKAKSAGDGGFDLFKPKVEHVDILLFSRQIHTLLKSGVPIMRALSGLQESATNPAMKDVIRDVRESLEAGRELSVSLARHPEVFNPFYISMVRVGEATGLLDEIFLRLFDHLEFERFMREQVKSALRYPTFVVMAMAAAIVVVNIFVIPAFAKVFQGFGAELPLMTQILLGFSNFMVTWWPAMLLGTIAAVFIFRAWVATAAGRMQWESMVLHFPIAGKIVRKAAMARFSRSFALGMRSGVPVMQALTNSSQTVDNSFIAAKIEGMR
ncbi:MAG: type II secretion system F family protein, partial [Dechloromonas sp.]|nr:type II secretion system F family protein [Dechloromonas sp.]